jgi:hypothetical protein
LLYKFPPPTFMTASTLKVTATMATRSPIVII